MKHRLLAVSDSDPAWTSRMEAWWNQGGALLWNQFGGLGKEEIVLTDEQLDLFVERAQKIDGWQFEPQSSAAGGAWPAQAAPVIIRPNIEAETTEEPAEKAGSRSTQCCRDCGRPFHPGLAPLGDQDQVTIPKRELNHLLNGLQEAIEFSRGNGPNNNRTWEAALEEGLEAIKPRG